MPYQVQQIIEGKGLPTCVSKEDTVAKALSLMIENDFSQLPVISTEQGSYGPIGMVTYESILRGVRNFKAKLENLRVRDVMVAAPVFFIEDDLFDILDRLKYTNAVLVTVQGDLVGIVTNYDIAEYFRNRIEDLMRVEDIELMVKEFIMLAYSDGNGKLDEAGLQKAINKVVSSKGFGGEKEKKFDDLTLGEYNSLLLLTGKWEFFDPIFGISRDFLRVLLNGVRETRNALAHFRGDITTEQRDQLKFAAEWFSRRRDEYEDQKQKRMVELLLGSASNVFQSNEKTIGTDNVGDESRSTEYTVTDSEKIGGKYAALSDWLQSQPGKVEQVQLTFDDIEETIQAELPASARIHRAWWANDEVNHNHSQAWLDAGWRTTYVNMGSKKVTFSRLVGREKAYISFFSKLLDELKSKADFPVKTPSPDGTSWIVIQNVPRSGTSYGAFSFSFSRDKRFRVELYLDLGSQAETKAVFDMLYLQKELIDAQISEVEWERLDSKRASRLALYHVGHIMDNKKLPELRKWGVENMIAFYHVLVEPIENAIHQVKSG